MLDASFFLPERLPAPLQSGHDLRIPKAVELARSGETFFDPAHSDAIDLPLHQRPDDEHL
jgi:hypothetical protein